MNVVNVLIFPCGSECGLEIHKALQHEKHVNVFGASSEDNNPGPFIYKNYIDEHIPYISEDGFIDQFCSLLSRHQINFIFPALDSVALYLSEMQAALPIRVVGSSAATNQICRSKRKSYDHLKDVVSVPAIYNASDIVDSVLPVFLKPDIGQGAQGTVLASDIDTITHHMQTRTDLLAMEYLPGKEFTVDCFSDRHGSVRFVGGRERRRIRSGIAVNSVRIKDERFAEWAVKINSALNFRGGWFFQVKENANGEFVLLEAAPRIAGTSALARNRGVNLPLLSLYDAMDIDVSILENDITNEIDRTFTNRFQLGAVFDVVYCDFDDCLVVRGKVNTILVEFLYRCYNNGKVLILLSRHAEDVSQSLERYRLSRLFDEIIHVTNESPKSKYITRTPAIFIDDSYREREEVAHLKGVIVLAPDSIEGLAT